MNLDLAKFRKREKKSSEKIRYNPIVFSLSFIRGVSAAVFTISIPFLNIYFFERGYKMALVGALTGIATILGSALRIPAGLIADKFGPIITLISGVAVRSISLLAIGILIALNADILFFVPFVLMNSAGFALLVLGSNSFVSYYFKDDEHPHVLSFIRVGINAGFSLGPLIGGFISEISYSALFILSGILSAILIFPTKKLKDRLEKSETIKNAHSFAEQKNIIQSPSNLISDDVLANGGKEEVPSSSRPVSRDILGLRRNSFSILLRESIQPFADRNFLPLMITVFFSASLISQFISNLPVFAKYVGIENKMIGYFFTINGASVVLLQVAITNFASRVFGNYKSVIFGIVIYAIFVISFGLNHNFFWFALCVFGLTVGEMLFMPFIMSIAMESSPYGKKGIYLGVYEFMEAAGWSFGRFFGGTMFDLLKDHPVIFWLSVSSGAPLSILSFLIFMRKGKQEKKESYTAFSKQDVSGEKESER